MARRSRCSISQARGAPRLSPNRGTLLLCRQGWQPGLPSPAAGSQQPRPGSLLQPRVNDFSLPQSSDDPIDRWRGPVPLPWGCGGSRSPGSCLALGRERGRRSSSRVRPCGFLMTLRRASSVPDGAGRAGQMADGARSGMEGDQSLLRSQCPAPRPLLSSRRGALGHPHQRHPQGGDLLHLQHGHPQAGGQLRLPCHRRERLRLRDPQHAFPLRVR